MEKLKIKNQRVPLFCAQFFLINNHGTESNHIKPIKPHCFCLTSFVLLQSFSEKSADTIPPAYLEVKGIWRSRIGAITIRIFTTSQAQR